MTLYARMKSADPKIASLSTLSTPTLLREGTSTFPLFSQFSRLLLEKQHDANSSSTSLHISLLTVFLHPRNHNYDCRPEKSIEIVFLSLLLSHFLELASVCLLLGLFRECMGRGNTSQIKIRKRVLTQRLSIKYRIQE